MHDSYSSRGLEPDVELHLCIGMEWLIYLVLGAKGTLLKQIVNVSGAVDFVFAVHMATKSMCFGYDG